MRSLAGSFILIIVLLAGSGILGAQVVGGSISGSITDAAGAVVSGASVTIHDLETGSERQIVSNSSGLYSAPSVPIGRYRVTVNKDSFAPYSQTGINVTIGE